MAVNLLPTILAALQDQVHQGTSPLTADQIAFLESLRQHGLQAPRAQLLLIGQIWRHLPADRRVGDLTAEDLAQAWNEVEAPCPWPAPSDRPAPFGTSHGAMSGALHRLDATFRLAREQGDHEAFQAYLALREAFLPFTECAPNPWAPAFAAVPRALTILDEVFADAPGAPAALHYATLRQACFEARDRKPTV